MPEPPITLLYDLTLRRPACVLLQAVYGGDWGALETLPWPWDAWLDVPTPGMVALTGTRAEWEQLAGWDAGRQALAADRARGAGVE